MELLLLRHLWGLAGTIEDTLPHLLQTGYDGVEAALPAVGEREDWHALLQRTNSRYIAQIFTSGATVTDHISSFRQQLSVAQQFQPLLVNSHSGRDAWSYEESRHFCREAVRIEADMGMPVAHETHRGRIFFHPWITQRLLAEVSEMWLCADFSHWVCVCESLLADETEVLNACIARVRHIHARVGYEEGPQVPDPRAPEYTRQVSVHEQWWDMIWQAQVARGELNTTLTPEFGPPPYLPTLPFTEMPVADLAVISDWQAQRQRFLMQHQ